MDPLRMAAQGVKKPLDQKGEKLQNLYNEQNRYYPVDPKGNLDEWGALIKRQTETYNRDQQAGRLAKQANAQAYGNELQRELQTKQDQSNLEKQYREGERDFMLRAVEAKAAQDRNQMEHYRNQQKLFADQAQQLIDQKNR